MTRKHYIAVANIIAEAARDTTIAQTPDAEAMRELLADELAIFFAEDNDAFDRERFLKACEVAVNV